MGNVLGGIEPISVLAYFEEICAIPHGSGNEDAISKYLESFGKSKSLDTYRDAKGNVIIKKPGSEGYESHEPVILQGHMDMVCEKLPDKEFDFAKDSIELIAEDGYIRANGTTLGADNGIGCAMIMAILSANDISHPPIEAVFTVSEEVGLLGAEVIDSSKLSAVRMLNLDSEEEGEIVAGCAGGCRMDLLLDVQYKKRTGKYYRFVLTGLKGGHSGNDIHLGRANANILMGRILSELCDEFPLSIVSLAGGNMDNAICTHCEAEVILSQKDLSSQKEKLFEERIPQIVSDIHGIYAPTEPDFVFRTEYLGIAQKKTFSHKSQKKALYLLNMVPNGVVEMHRRIQGMPETSLNLGIMRTDENVFRITYALRSNIAVQKEYLKKRLMMIADCVGANYRVHGDYPGWDFVDHSQMQKVVSETYEKLFGKKPKVSVIHAGLECGYFAKKLPGLDAVSIGPSLYDIHTVNERADIAGIERCWEYVKCILKEL